jgi:hypothetical protein
LVKRPNTTGIRPAKNFEHWPPPVGAAMILHPTVRVAYSPGVLCRKRILLTAAIAAIIVVFVIVSDIVSDGTDQVRDMEHTVHANNVVQKQTELTDNATDNVTTSVRIETRQLQEDVQAQLDDAPMGVPHPKTHALARGHNWCCTNIIHVGKTAGNTVGAAFLRHSVSPPIKFHHPYEYFLRENKLVPHGTRCFSGMVLRDPVARFISSYWWCLGRECPRRSVGCGFLCCDKGSLLHQDYAQNKNMSIARFVSERAKLARSGNSMVKMLGSCLEDVYPYLSARAGDMQSHALKILRDGTHFADKLIVKNDTKGRAMLEIAKQRLRAFEYVYLVEALDFDLNFTFGEHTDKHNAGAYNPGLKDNNLDKCSSENCLNDGLERKQAHIAEVSEEVVDKIRDMNSLDVELYEYAVAERRRRASLREGESGGFMRADSVEGFLLRGFGFGC